MPPTHQHVVGQHAGSQGKPKSSSQNNNRFVGRVEQQNNEAWTQNKTLYPQQGN